MIMNIIKMLFVYLLFTFSPLSMSEESPSDITPTDGYEYRDIDHVTDDMFNRLLLAMFGKDYFSEVLPFGTPSYIKDEIKSFTKVEMITKTAPFDDSVKIFTTIIISAAKIVALMYFFAFGVVAFIIKVMNSQSDGSFLGGAKDASGYLSKILGSALLIVPSDGHPILFKVILQGLAESNLATKRVIDTMVDTSISALPDVVVPSPTRAIDFGNEMMEFSTCLEINSSKILNTLEKESVNFYINLYKNEDGLYMGSSNIPFCPLDIEVGDELFLDGLDESFTLFDPDLIKKNKEIIINAKFQEIFDLSRIYASNFINFAEDLGESEADGFVAKAVKFVSQLNQMVLKFIDGVINSELFTLDDNWESSCESSFKNTTLEEYKKLTNSSRSGVILGKYYETSKNCISYALVKKFVYPLEGDDYIKNYVGTSPLYENNLEYSVCKSGQKEDSKVFIEPTSDNIFGATPYIGDFGYINVDQCVLETCKKVISANTFGNSHLFECSNAINLKLEQENKQHIKDSGWLTIGAYIYALNSNYVVPADSKYIINSTKVEGRSLNDHFNKFDKLFYDKNRQVFSDKSSEDGVISLKIEFNENKDINGRNVDQLDLMSKVSYVQDQMDGVKELQEPMKRLFGYGDTGNKGFLGINKFLSCIKSPYRFENGFNCNSLQAEMQEFGAKILTLGVTLWSLNVIGGSLWDKQRNKRTSISERGKFKNLMGSDSPILKKALTLAASVVGSIVAYEFLFKDSNGFMFSGQDYFSDSDVSLTSQISVGITPVVYLLLVRQLREKDASEGKQGVISSTMQSLPIVLIVLGLFLTTILLLLPFMFFFFAVASWMKDFFSLLVYSMIWLAASVRSDSNEFDRALSMGISLVVSVFLRMPLIVAGLALAWFLSSFIVPELIFMTGISELIIGSETESLTGFVDGMVVIVVFIVCLWVLYSYVFSLVEGLFDAAQSIINDSSNFAAFGQKTDRGEMGGYAAIFGKLK